MSAWFATTGATWGIADPGTLVISTLVFLMLPGPGTFAVLTAAARGGLSGGFAALGGLMLGDLTLMALAGSGVAALLAAHPLAFRAVQYAGVAYLFWIGVQLLRVPSAVPRGSMPNASGSPSRDRTPSSGTPRARDAFRAGLLVTLLNPKAIMFYMAFFPLFIDPQRHRGMLTLVAMAATIGMLTLAYGALLVVVGNTLARRLADSHSVAALARRAAGIALMAFGVKLAIG